MSAPLVVNTRDGVCWTRRTVTSGGIALYAPEQVRTCPGFVMATIDELAEHGIVGSADALPMPVGPEPRAEPRAFRLVGEVTADDYDEAVWAAEQAVSGMRGQGYKGSVWVELGDGKAEQLRARVAELESERHSTNESLSKAAEQLRVDRDRIAELEASPLAWAEKLDAKSLDNFLIALASATEHEPLDGAIAQIHELIRSYREGNPAEEDCDHPNGHGPNGCAGCGAFRPADNKPGMRHAVRSEGGERS
ncbi:hypothetical protein ACFUN7_24535 [Streptomyces sp. NPDC057236]|uniref:hypothetical protein n=1 Tax=Streptomyces sp. NPDC057236 TaxID=3346059 RepID=UPI00363C1EDC